LRPIEVTLGDGRVMRVSGIAAGRDNPAVMFIEDVSVHHRQERVMREFLRNAAHQLRTPLAGITSAVEMLQSGAKERPGDRDLFLDHIATHSQRLARLARGLLLLARTEAGGSLPLDYVELGPLLEEVTENAEAEPGVDIRAECEPGLAAVAEPDLLQEAVTALVDNAIQHTRDGEIRVTAARANGGVVLRVTDTGAGILPEFQDRLFEPFFRLAPSGEGYGLGLAIAAQAVRAMHGKIDVSSTPGSGTVFTVHLPSAGVTR
jgi:signal transduction histidine kinase